MLQCLLAEMQGFYFRKGVNRQTIQTKFNLNMEIGANR